MSTGKRSLQYKSSSDRALTSIRQKVKQSVTSCQIRGREDILSRKRLKVNASLEANEILFKFSEEEENRQVLEAIKLLKKSEKLTALTDLHRLFSSHPSNTNTFLTNNGLQALRSCLWSHNVEVLHTAAWCVINLTASVSSVPALLSLAPTLTQFLRGSDTVMQELCAWGLANVAGDSASNAEVLHTQGFSDILLDLLVTVDQIASVDRTRSVLFALCNMTRGSRSCIKRLHERDLCKLLHTLFAGIGVDSSLNFELGWFVHSVLHCSTLEDCDNLCSEWFPVLAKILTQRLICMAKGLDKVLKHQCCFPIMRCLSHLVASNALIARVLLDYPQAFDTIVTLLTFGPDGLKQETMTLINNCAVDVCSRVLLAFQPKMLSVIFLLCLHDPKDLATQALQIVQSMVKTSFQVDTHLLLQGVTACLVKVVSSLSLSTGLKQQQKQQQQHLPHQTSSTPSSTSLTRLSQEDVSILSLVLEIWLDLLSSQPQLTRERLKLEETQSLSTCLHSMLSRLSEEHNTELSSKAVSLLNKLELT